MNRALTPADAEYLRHLAAAKRAHADTHGDPLHAEQNRAEAAALDDLAANILAGAPRITTRHGGELVLVPDPDMPARHREAATAASTPPAAVQAEAALDRLALARDAGVLPLALDTAADAATPAERMIAHELAAAHTLAMKLMTRADGFLNRRIPEWDNTGRQAANLEAARSTAAAARLMEATARAALTLDRLRHGPRQTVTVQHVTVADGGQAVVAGSVAPGRRRKRR